MVNRNSPVSECYGSDGLVCIGGYLYSSIGFMIFPANKKCPICNPESEKDDEE